MRYSIPDLILALLFTFAFSILGHLLFVLGALRLLQIHLISLEFMIWGTAIMVMTQLTRGLMDHRRGMNVLYGLTHAPANVLVLLLLMNSARRSLSGTVTWKGECTSLQSELCGLFTRRTNVYVYHPTLSIQRLSEGTTCTKNDRVVAILNLTGFSRGCFDIDISHG